MQVKLIGLQKIEFQNANGEVVKGNNIFCTFADENVEGLRAEKFYVRDGIVLPECKPQDTLELHFNMKGKIEKITK